MTLPTFTMRQLLEAGVHFGHQSHRWNPKMASYIFGERNNIHILDLAQTVPMLHHMLQAVSDTVAGGGRVLFVGTKRQASEAVADAARRSAQYYVNARWLGGTLTNWKTISHSIQRLRKLEELLGDSGEAMALTKKERLKLTREREKLERSLGGIKDMGGQPDMLFVIDTNKESIAIKEARRLGIPVAAIVDSNCDPDGISYPVPGNDDAGRAINFYCDMVARAAIDGISRGQGDMGVDVGASEEPVIEPALAEAPKPKDQPKAEEVVAEAKPATEETIVVPEVAAPTFELLAAPRGAPDDLKKISGVGPVLEQKLNDMGVFHYWQIVALGEDDIQKIDEELTLHGRITRDGWIDQARRLAEGEAE
ncbi:30S ribosomal protein S2 [Microbaculum marinisediminis]|uniref:Small ribosomal subunit protein uS2 n=1 Tax=Microbaculum marinisediminis TaxID=2931392 RepID=A0AAW5R4Q0_9HYPH|nr:30S ribosomal protein S2 [Microbaculum sp. A6E488]MCT8974377.1 30S ribosomal protein S2 [Microbaculum sp. A6E488]